MIISLYVRLDCSFKYMDTFFVYKTESQPENIKILNCETVKKRISCKDNKLYHLLLTICTFLI